MVRAFTAAKVRDESAASAPVAREATATVRPESVPALVAIAGETNQNLQETEPLVATMTVSGPVCRMEVAFGYVPPARGVTVLVRELERV